MYFSMATICSICLNERSDKNLSCITEVSSTDICFQDKLRFCVPEVDWRNDYKICIKCSEDLQNAYSFRHLCIALQDERFTRCEYLENELKSEDKNVSVINSLSEDETCDTHQNIFSSSEHKKLENETNAIEHIDKIEINDFTLEDVIKTEVSIYEATENKNECDICGTSFNTKYLLKRHRKNVHATEKNFKCDICTSSFVSSVYLNAHKKYHFKDRKYVCLFCGKRYITKSDLYHHEKIHANKRAYVCPECHKAFNTSSDLHKHKICVHLDKSLWKYSCKFCNRKFPLKTNLDTHTKIHTGEKNFCCHLCDKKYISRSALTRHIESHSNVKQFKCTICDTSYKYKISLNIHMRKNHGIGNAKIPEKVKTHFCHICPKSYYANSKLQKHLRSHSGEKPFKCPKCDKGFVDKSYIKQHLKISHNAKED